MKLYPKLVFFFLVSGLVAMAAKAQTTPGITNLLAALPLAFESNQGQTDPQVRFLARGKGYGLFLTPAEAVLTLTKHRVKNTPDNQEVVRMRLEGGNRLCRMEGCKELSGVSNYFIGKNPEHWRTKVKQYAQVRLRDVYPGIDMVYYGNQGQLEYDLVVKPGADPGAVRLKWEGTGKLKVDGGGDLVLNSGGKNLLLKKPVAYQESGGVRQPVEDRYVLLGKGRVGFQVGDYDRTWPLVIDPTVVYSTFLGGNNIEYSGGIAVDGSGNAYVTGLCGSTDFPITPGAAQTVRGSGNGYAYVTKINAAGTSLIYSTFLGGTNASEGWGIAVDGSGCAYLTGVNAAPDFPVTSGAPQTALGNSLDSAFITKINAAGTSLVYSTLLGGTSTNKETWSWGIALDNLGDAYVTGQTWARDFPVSPGAPQTQLRSVSYGNAFVTQINSAGTSWVYSTYLGGSSTTSDSGYVVNGRCCFDGDVGFGIAVDASGNAYVTGIATSSDFPVTPGAPQTVLSSIANVFITKVNSAGTSWVYSTYLGGSGRSVGSGDYGAAIAVDNLGDAYVAGEATSSDFPLVNPLEPFTSPEPDGFLTKVNAAGTTWVYSTYLTQGGPSDFLTGIALDSSSNAYVTDTKGYVSKVNSAGSSLIYALSLGGTGVGIAVDGGGNAYVTGNTDQGKFLNGPITVTAGAAQTLFGGYQDAYIAKVSPLDPTPTATATNSPTDTPTHTATNSPTPTPTDTPTLTPINTPTSSPTNSPTTTLTPTITSTSTQTMTPTFTLTPSYSGPNTPGPGTSFVYPSPATGPLANIAYFMQESGRVGIRIWTESAELALDFSDIKPSGPQTSQLNIQGWTPGIYFYRVVLQYNSGKVEAFKPGKFAILR